jgi:hypothetical protein
MGSFGGWGAVDEREFFRRYSKRLKNQVEWVILKKIPKAVCMSAVFRA